jgi:hypothetical protein
MCISRLATPILAMLVAAGCAGPRASYDYEPSVDFSAYRQWAWLPKPQEESSGDPRIDNSLTRNRIESAVARNLAAKGFNKTEPAKADFDVGYVVMVDKQLDSGSGVSTSVGYGRWSGGSGFGISFGGPGTTLREQEVGTLLIDVRDHESGNLLWRGSSKRRIGQSTTPEESERVIDEIVGEILANFPPPAGD